MITIFLDVDGVLNHHQCLADAHKAGSAIGALDNKCIERLKTIVTPFAPETYQIVLSSTWRRIEPLCEILQARLERFGLRFTSQTDTKGKLRGEEIKRWLDARPEVNPKRILILDDDSDMLPDQLPFFVQTSMKTGLLEEHVQKAIEILRIPVDSSGA